MFCSVCSVTSILWVVGNIGGYSKEVKDNETFCLQWSLQLKLSAHSGDGQRRLFYSTQCAYKLRAAESAVVDTYSAICEHHKNLSSRYIFHSMQYSVDHNFKSLCNTGCNMLLRCNATGGVDIRAYARFYKRQLVMTSCPHSTNACTALTCQ